MCGDDPKSLVVAANAKYHVGNFEHALKYFNRWSKILILEQYTSLFEIFCNVWKTIQSFKSVNWNNNFRAHSLRPGYYDVEQGINKSKDAIENCLCRDGFTFDGMKDVRFHGHSLPLQILLQDLFWMLLIDYNFV